MCGGGIHHQPKPKRKNRKLGNDQNQRILWLDLLFSPENPSKHFGYRIAMLMVPSKVAGHTRFLLESFNGSDVDSIAQEICQVNLSLSLSFELWIEFIICILSKTWWLQLVDVGIETSIPALKTCIDCFTVRRSHPNALQLEKLVSLVFKRVLNNSNNLQTLISHALQDVEVTDDFVDDLTNALGFSIPEKVSVALVLADSERSDAKSSGAFFFIASSPRFGLSFYLI